MGDSSNKKQTIPTGRSVNETAAVNHDSGEWERDFLLRFPDDRACLDYLLHRLFGEQTACPKCGCMGKFHKIRQIPAYACQWCGYHLHPMAKTRFARSRIGLRAWFYAIALFAAAPNNITARQLERKLGLTYKSAWRVRNTIIEAKFNISRSTKSEDPPDFEGLLSALLSPRGEDGPA
jgi:transposase-like protein